MDGVTKRVMIREIENQRLVLKLHYSLFILLLIFLIVFLSHLRVIVGWFYATRLSLTHEKPG